MTIEVARAAWTEALGPVIALMDPTRQGMFRQELQRFLATARFQPEAADEVAGQLQKLLLQAARAARAPAAISATRDLTADRATMSSLCEHLLAGWRDAEAAVQNDRRPACEESGSGGGVFFGPRLGGTGRDGAVRRDDE